MISIAVFAGFAAGMLIQYLLSRATQVRLESEIALRDERINSEAARVSEREATLSIAQQNLATAFRNLAHESLEKNSEHFLRLAGQKFEVHQEKAKAELTERQQAVETLVKPIRDALEKTRLQISEIEKTRNEAYGSITQHLQAMASGQDNLRSETSKLVSALRRPQVRGQWGEMTLRRLAELAGMVQHCDFSEQVHTTDEANKGYRPDMLIRLPERGQLVVDVKTPLDAYIDAIEANDDAIRKAALQRHARNLQDRIKELASKAYFEQFERSPEFVILFVPGDQFLTAALDEKPGLIEEALRQKVLLITPTSFVALLKVIAYGWMQLRLAENAEDIRKLAVELQDRLGTFTGHLAAVGKRLDDSVQSYNKAIASLETRVLPSARKIRELGADGSKDIPATQRIDITARELKLNVDDLNTTIGKQVFSEDPEIDSSSDQSTP
jgi:DNA recombination protein RmuC